MSLTDQLVDNKEQKLINDVYDFIRYRYIQADENTVKNLIWMHFFYGTMDVIYRNEKLIACTRWNISTSGEICEVLDLFISEGENGFRIMKHIIARNWHRFPSVKFIRFARVLKYKGRKERLYSIKELLKPRS